MAKETASKKVKNAGPRRGHQEGDKVVHREKARKSAGSSVDRAPAPGTNYMKNRNRRDWERKQGRQQAVRERGAAMMVILAKKMHSPSPKANEELITIAADYLGAYTAVSELSWLERHVAAKKVALKDCTPALRRFAEHQLENADRQTRPARKGAGKSADRRQRSEQPMVAATS